MDQEEEYVLYESYNTENGKIIILDNDEHSVWAFILDGETQEIEFDGFVCSLSKPFENEEEVEKVLEEGGAPAITKEFASDFAYQPDALNKEFAAEWQDDGYVFVYLDGELVLVMDLEEEVSFSKSISENGPYGLALTDEVLGELGIGEENEE